MNNTQVDNYKDLYAVMPMYSWKTSRSFWKYCRDEQDKNIKDSE